jgi:hypothetical protein
MPEVKVVELLQRLEAAVLLARLLQPLQVPGVTAVLARHA